MRPLALTPPILLTLIMAAQGQVQAQPQGPIGYLGPDNRPEAARVLAPPPQKGSDAQALDQKIFDETRALKGTPRWELAVADADQSPKAAMADFACPLGAELTPENAPALTRIFVKAGIDHTAVVNSAKTAFGRLRPFVGNDAPICVPREDHLAKSMSYPSGHATMGWTWAMILAELAPDRATEILARGRSIGESRVVCGVHWASDVEQGPEVGSILVTALQSRPDFQADMKAAKAEVDAVRAAGNPPTSNCAVQAEAALQRPW